MHSDPHADQLAFDVDGASTPVDSSTPSASAVTEPSTPPSSSASALDMLLDEYRARATSEREKGTLFEELTRQFLLHDARFAHQFKEVYLWSEWPERRTGEMSIDLVAIPISHITLADLNTHGERLDARMNSMKLNGQVAENIIVAQVPTVHTKTDTEETTGIQLGAYKHVLYSFTRNHKYASISEEHSQDEEDIRKITATREVISTGMKGETN